MHVHNTVGVGSERLQNTFFRARADGCVVVGPPGISFGVVDCGGVMP